VQGATSRETSVEQDGWFNTMLSGWVARPEPSNWTRLVTRVRIIDHDRIRPFATRGLLLAILAACLAWLGTPGWALTLLAPAAVQVALEILFEPSVRRYRMPGADDVPVGRIGHLVVRSFYANHERGITNVTGLLGLLAVAANLIAVIFGPYPGADPEPVRVAALAAAILYANSASLGPLLDVTDYSPNSRLGPASWQAIRTLWLGVAALLAGVIVATQATADAWGASFWYALLTVGLTYYPMLRVREYERDLAAAKWVRDDQDADLLQQVVRELHNLLQPVKEAPLKEVMKAMTGSNRLALESFLIDMHEILAWTRVGRLDPREGLALPLQEYLRRQATAAGGRFEVRIHLGDLADDDYRLAKSTLVILVDNALQGYASAKAADAFIEASAILEGPWVIIEVSDGLPLIPDDTWNNETSTLRNLRVHIESKAGSMNQVKAAGRKTIGVRWKPFALLLES